MKLKRRVNNSEIFIEIDRKDKNESYYQLANTGFTWIVFEFQGPLIFINAFILKNKFYKLIGCYLKKQELESKECYRRLDDLYVPNIEPDLPKKKSFTEKYRSNRIETIIFDCTRLSYLDAKGVETLLQIMNFVQRYNARLILTSCSRSVFNTLKRNNFFKHYNIRQCYMTIMDAVADLEPTSTVRQFKR